MKSENSYFLWVGGITLFYSRCVALFSTGNLFNLFLRQPAAASPHPCLLHFDRALRGLFRNLRSARLGEPLNNAERLLYHPLYRRISVPGKLL